MSDGRLPARRRWIQWTIGAVVTVLLLAIGWVIIRGAGAISEMQNVERSASQLRTSLTTGDLNRVAKIAPRVTDHAALAHALTSDPIWRAFEFVPWLGTNFTAMREVAEIADSVAADAVTVAIDVSADLDLSTLGVTGSKIDFVAFPKVEAALAGATTKLAAADLQAQQINADGVIAPLTNAVRGMRDAIAATTATIGALHGASVLLPSMLGADGPRDYVVAMQNNAEVRSDGGSVDSLTLLHAENGSISIQRQASAKDFPALVESLPLTESTTALFEDRPGRFVQNITSIPDFTEAGATIALRWEAQFGGNIDGVIAVDTGFTEHLAKATGPVSFGSFTADTDTIVQILLSTLYAEGEPAQQNAVFAQAANALFTAALSSGEPRQIIGALADAAGEGRIRIWSAHPDEEEFLAATSLGGTLPKDDERGTYVGVLFNDLTGGKMNYYTEAAVSTAVGTCSGEPTTQVQVTWTNNAPADAAESLSASVTGVTGGTDEEMDPGDVRTLIAVYGPEGATVRDADPDADADDSLRSAMLGTRSVIQHDVVLAPGESTTITVSFVGDGAGDRLTRVQHTPMIEALETTRGELICE